MEFPDLGKHCSEKSCKQLDYLPLNCAACNKVFCKAHVQLEQHKCSASYKKDVRVPVCPVCHVPVPVRRGETADVVIGQHMDKDCKYNPSCNQLHQFSLETEVPLNCNLVHLNILIVTHS
uniref:AN1-type domain-containing protein n=1 Tax=Sarcophilus harrisii TaxID=9305 RepID=A0A7N4PF17_SARHA